MLAEWSLLRFSLRQYSLNKHAANFSIDDAAADGGASGSKWTLRAYRRKVEEMVGAEQARQAWKNVDAMIVKSLICVEGTINEAMEECLPAVPLSPSPLAQLERSNLPRPTASHLFPPTPLSLPCRPPRSAPLPTLAPETSWLSHLILFPEASLPNLAAASRPIRA